MSDPKVDLLAEALLEGELIRRYDDYARAAYPVTMKRDHEALLATDWAAHILAASPRLAAALDRWPSPDDEAAVAELAAVARLLAFRSDEDDSRIDIGDLGSLSRPSEFARAILTRLREAAK